MSSEQEVTITELSNKFLVTKNYERNTGWHADLTLTDRETGSQFNVGLNWDENWGYDFEPYSPLNPKLRELMERPEFEYVLDCVMRGDIS